jgi:uncharacterized membrane protein
MLAYVYSNHMGWGWGILMMLGWLTLLALLVGAVLAAVRGRRSPPAREILDRRLASGEIDHVEYERAREAMSHGDSDRPATRPPAPA